MAMQPSSLPDIVGAYYAKTHLSELLDRVEKGERITITRHGQPIAELTPKLPPIDRDKIRQTIKEMRELAQESVLGDISIRELIEDGRKY